MLEVEILTTTTLLVYRQALSADGVQVTEECAHFDAWRGPLPETVDGFTRYCVLGGHRASPPLALVTHQAQVGEVLPEPMREAVKTRLKVRKSHLTIDRCGVLAAR